MPLKIHPDFAKYEAEIRYDLDHFDEAGRMFVDGRRNKIKLFDSPGPVFNIKSFRVPNLVNRIAYRFFRKSKARRSFEFADKLTKMSIGTPQPIAFSEDFSSTGLQKSFYISTQLDADLTYRELVEIPDYPDHENILRQFTNFCVDLHSKGIEFLDHSPGNTLIMQTSPGVYGFYLVDLNRMAFNKSMNFGMRMKNLSRLTPKREMIAVMSNEYAKHYPEKTEAEIFDRMWKETDKFQKKFHWKIRIKQQLGLRK